MVRPIRLLLINPRAPESFWSFRWAIDEVLPGKRAVNPPLGLATLAALCPSWWEVEIVDENIEPVPLAPTADIVGICGMGVQFPRQRELMAYYRGRGFYVVAGGSYASLCPEEYSGIADAVVAGEAEGIWPQFCEDFEAGRPQRLYQQRQEVSLSDSPVPRFDLLKLDRYSMVSLQFSRGCPFTCEFCDIIVMFGRKPRTKSPEQICAELDVLRAHGVRNTFFVDDNFIGNKPQARQLLCALAEYQERHGYKFRFGTEASLNLAQDAEMMRLLRQANFRWVFVGLESPDAECLKETGKLQNTREDMLTSIRRLYANGIDVFAGFIVGFDHDTPATFERQREFIINSGIQVAMVGMLTALPRTPLHARLQREGRLLPDLSSDNTRLASNVVPKQMTLEQMRRGYQDLYRRLLSDSAIAARIRAKMRHLKPRHEGSGHTLMEQMAIIRRLVLRGLRPGGWKRWWHFSLSAGFASPRQLPMVIAEWIAGLSMKAYAERFVTSARDIEARVVERCAARLQRKLRRWIDDGALELHLQSVRNALPDLSITVREAIEAKAIRRAARQLRKILRTTASTITIRIEACDRRGVERLLRRLSRYGDRVHVSVSETVRAMVRVDWSRFHLLLDPLR